MAVLEHRALSSFYVFIYWFIYFRCSGFRQNIGLFRCFIYLFILGGMAFVRRKGSFAECWTLFQILQLFCQNVGLFSHNIGLVCQSTGSFDNEQHVGPTVVANFMPCFFFMCLCLNNREGRGGRGEGGGGVGGWNPMHYLRHPPNQTTEIPRYQFRLDQIFDLNLYREIPRIWVSRFGGSLGCGIFSGNYILLSSKAPHSLLTKRTESTAQCKTPSCATLLQAAANALSCAFS
jgi:hypothetical protein